MESYSPLNLDKRFSVQACNTLNELRKANQLCDVSINVEKNLFPVHRVIMASCSCYFRALFANGMREAGLKEVDTINESYNHIDLYI